jgi:hypothetical protein
MAFLFVSYKRDPSRSDPERSQYSRSGKNMTPLTTSRPHDRVDDARPAISPMCAFMPTCQRANATDGTHQLNDMQYGTADTSVPFISGIADDREQSFLPRLRNTAGVDGPGSN